MPVDEVNIGKDAVRKIVVEDLRKQKICSCFVPHSLTPEQKDRRTAACRYLIATADSDPDFVYLILDIQKAVTSTLNTIAKDDFYKGIQKLYDRANQCVQLEGMYVENWTIKVLFLPRKYFL